MNLFLMFIFLLIILDIKCEEDCKSTGALSTKNRLIEHLLCNYGRHKMDRFYSDKIVTFNVRLLPEYVEFEKQADTLQIFTWLNVSWSDTDLMWEPIRWDGIRWINVNDININIPKVAYLNQYTTIYNSLKNCLLTYEGSIHCVTSRVYENYCPTNYNEWPYDKHNCTLYIRGYPEYNDNMLSFGDNTVNMTAFRPNKRWHVSMAAKIHLWANTTHRDEEWLAVSFLLERRGSGLAIIYILPIVVFMILTLLVLWLDSQSLERMIVASINLVFHILGLCNVHKDLSIKGSLTTKTPQIILSYEASIGLAAYALIFTCFLRKLRSLNVSAPSWLISGTTLVISSPVTPYLGIPTKRKRQTDLLHESENDESPNNSIWQELATILEWISFVIVFVTYVTVLGIVLAPRERF